VRFGPRHAGTRGDATPEPQRHPAPPPPLPSPGESGRRRRRTGRGGAGGHQRADPVIGDGTPASCTSDASVAAVAAGGVITFSCGPAPVTITMTATAKVVNARPKIVLDGGGRVT
jgi:hypothetical protein